MKASLSSLSISILIHTAFLASLCISCASSFAPPSPPHRSLSRQQHDDGVPLPFAPLSRSNLKTAWSATESTSSTANAAETVAATTSTTGFWKWRDHDIFTEVRTPAMDIGSNMGSSSNKPTIILLHGFGASTTYWRETMTTLQNEGYEVHALDLLGQGRSSKPFPRDSSYLADGDAATSTMTLGENTNVKIKYSINLWANMIDDYARQHQLGTTTTNNADGEDDDDGSNIHNNQGVVLMGNSLGSLVALAAATGDFLHLTSDNTTTATASSSAYLAGNSQAGKSSSLIRGICLFNCAVGLNSQNVLKNPSFSPIQRTLLNGVFDVLNSLIFDNEALLTYALNNIVTKDLLRNALQGLYTKHPERVDDEIVDSFYYPAKFGGDGAVEAIRQIYTNDAGLTPMEMHDRYSVVLDSIPLHLIWGDEDVVTPITGDVGTFYCDRVANNRGGRGMTTMDVVRSGHMPFDDNPVESHGAMMRWLERKVVKL